MMVHIEEEILREHVTVRVTGKTIDVYTHAGVRLASFRRLEKEYKFPGWSSEDLIEWFWEWVDVEELAESCKEYGTLRLATMTARLRSVPRKLTATKALEICQTYDSMKISQHELARKFGVSRTMIAGILQGRYWQHVTGRGLHHEQQ